MAGDLSISTLGGAFISDRNAIINGNFSVNQRAVSGTVTLAAGAYGHDRWKAGAGGCTYTFATVNNVTTLTISAGTLMQVIEGINLQSGTYTLSWSGTAQGRVDSGSYGASGTTGTAVGGTNQTIEFGTGTLSKVQYEPGTTATSFVQRQYGYELALCQRYYWRTNGTSTTFPAVRGSAFAATAEVATTIAFPVPMRTSPTVTKQGTWSLVNCGQPTVFASDNIGFTLFVAGSGAGNVDAYPNGSTTYVDAVAEL